MFVPTAPVPATTTELMQEIKKSETEVVAKMPMPEAPAAPKLLSLNVNAPLFDPSKMPAFVPTAESSEDAKKKSKSARKKSRAKAAAAAVQQETSE